jgi:hypothetical protein
MVVNTKPDGINEMDAKVYMSNISPLWPFHRQDQLIADALAARGITRRKDFVDELSVNERKAHHDEHLTQREQLMRPSTRKDGGLIVLPSLAVFSWSVEGMIAGLTRLAANRATVWVVDADITLKPRADTRAWAKAAEAFHTARKREQAEERGKAGGLASAAKRSKEEAALSIKEDWSLSPHERGFTSTIQLLMRADIANYSTAAGYLGSRPIAQKNRQAALKRKAKREAKRQKEGARV